MARLDDNVFMWSKVLQIQHRRLECHGCGRDVANTASRNVGVHSRRDRQKLCVRLAVTV